MNRKCFLFLSVLILVSCKDNSKQQFYNHQLKITKTTGYVVPKNRINQPITYLAEKPKVVTAGKPKVIFTNKNIVPAGIPTIRIAGQPNICKPGLDTFAFPETITAIDSPFIAGIPELVIAKDFYSKDHNPENFLTYKKLQGLTHSAVSCLLEDKHGNLWIGTQGGGVSKYDGKFFTHFTAEEGLNETEITCMAEDNDGNLWFGTYGGGVLKYDGKFFTIYTEKQGLCNNVVLSALKDKEGNLWFGTYGGGVSKYEARTFTHFTTRQGLSNNVVINIFQDHAGSIWFGTYGGGVSKYDGKSFANYTEKEGLANNIVWSAIQDKNGDMWFGTQGSGVSKLGRSEIGGKMRNTFTHYTKKEGLSDDDVRYILEDKAGDIWFGTNKGGATKFNGKTFTHYTEKEGLINNVTCIVEDSYGSLWFGAYGGVSKYVGPTFTHYTEEEGLASNNINSILQDKSGNVWFGTYGAGVSKFNGTSFAHYTVNEGLNHNIIISMCEDSKGNVWFGTNGGGVSKYNGKSFTHFTREQGLCDNDVRAILEDSSGNMWFGTYNGVSKYDGKFFTRFTAKEGLCNSFVLSMLVDKRGNIWFGTKGGVSKYDGHSFTNFTTKEGLSNNFVVSLLEDHFGNLWFGTYGGGICRYDGRSIINLTTSEGLLNNFVLSMVESRLGNIWFGTRLGVSRLSFAKSSEINAAGQSPVIKEPTALFKNYTYQDGFLGVGCNANTMYQSQDDLIWIGTNDRLTAYHPPSSNYNPAGNNPNHKGPEIQITGISLFNEDIGWINFEKKRDTSFVLSNSIKIDDFYFDSISNWFNLPQKLSLAYDNNNLTFHFIGISLNQPKRVKYQYKLEGFDKNWSALTPGTEAPYGNLPDGTFTFVVKAMNSEACWSNEIRYTFSIRPPWWQTWWFRSFAFIVIITAITFYIRWRERALKREKELLELKVKRRTAEVVQQKQLIEEKHKEITDSINYAERIQRSFLATKELLDENLLDQHKREADGPGYFVLFQPKDIVSGDFYWAGKLANGNFIFTVADSTGHGVPGAIMSILNIFSLEKAVEQHTRPADILNNVRQRIIERLSKDGSPDGGKDGMDCSLMSFDFKNNTMTYAAAYNSIYIIRKIENDLELVELKADSMPVGKHDKDTIPFNQKTIQLQKGDVIYSFTDGLPDQFGGPQGKKFMYKQFKNLLLSCSGETMDFQKQKLEQALKSWKGGLEQVDDICIAGIRV